MIGFMQIIRTKKHFISGVFAGQKVVEETLKLLRIEGGSTSDEVVSNFATSAEDALEKIRSVSDTPLSGLTSTTSIRPVSTGPPTTRPPDIWAPDNSYPWRT